jgi:hypothetical protein
MSVAVQPGTYGVDQGAVRPTSPARVRGSAFSATVLTEKAGVPPHIAISDRFSLPTMTTLTWAAA